MYDGPTLVNPLKSPGEGLTPALRLDLDEPQDDVAVALSRRKAVSLLSESLSIQISRSPFADLRLIGHRTTTIAA